jgi:hypothetical protein
VKKRVQTGEGEGNEKSAFSEDFLELQQRYHDATFEERNRLWPEFIRAIRGAAPGFIEEFDRAFRGGDYLMAMFEQCMKLAFARPDLDAGRKTNALEDTSVFLAVFDELNQVDPAVRELAFDLATRALFAGLRAGLSPEEVEGFRARFLSDRQRELGEKRKKEKPWRAYTRMLAFKIPEKNRALPKTKIAGMLWDEWAKEKPAEWEGVKPARPAWDTLVDFVGELRADGTLPPGPIRARRPPG